eukprot:7754561-Pyramimonas_sp.AAC.1
MCNAYACLPVVARLSGGAGPGGAASGGRGARGVGGAQRLAHIRSPARRVPALRSLSQPRRPHL